MRATLVGDVIRAGTQLKQLKFHELTAVDLENIPVIMTEVNQTGAAN